MTTLSRTEDLQHDSRTSNMFVVPSILDSTMSTEYRWATDSVAGGNDRLQRLASPFFDHGELSRLTEEDSAVQNDETSHVKHLAELLDEFNQTHPTTTKKPAAATVVQDTNSGSDLTTSTGFTSTAESSLVQPEIQTAGSPGAKGPTAKMTEAAMTRENKSEAELSRSSVASSPASFDSRSYSDSDYNTETIRLTDPANPERTPKAQPKSREQVRRPSEVITDPAANFTPMRSKSAGAAAAAENQSPSSRPHQTLANGDTTFLLKQLRQLTVECENRDNLISEMQAKEKEFEQKERQWETQQQEFKKQQQDLLRQQEVQFQRMLAQIESLSRAQTAATDAESKDLTADLPLAQSSVVKDRVALESVADSDLDSVAEEVSFAYVFDQSRTGIYEPFERDRAAAAAVPAVAVEDTVVVHPIPKRPAQVQKPQPVKPGPSSSPAAARTEEELRLLKSLSASLRHSLSLEQNLEDARSEIGRLQGLVESLLKQKQNADLQARVSPLLQPASSTPPFEKEHVTFHKISPSISPVKAAVQPPSSSGNNATNGDSSAPLSEKTGELEKLVAEYGREIAKLKGRASVMGPADMPDARSYTAFKSDKLYYRLQMDKVDELGVSELGNIVKNILLQLNIPFSELQTCIMSLPVHFESEDRYMHFANDVHRALYFGSQIDPDGTLPLGEGSLHEMECLGEMLARIEKLARAAERREKKRRAAAGRQ